MIQIIGADGIPYTDFVSARCTISVESLSNDFEFTASAVNGFPPFKDGDPITVLVDGVKRLTGNIAPLSGSESEGSHVVIYTGRDRTADFFDSQIAAINDIRADGQLTLKIIIEKVLSHIGLDIKVIDNLNPKPFNEAEDVGRPKQGEGCFEFVMKWARKRQALLSSDGDGNIVITQSSPENSGAALQSVKGADDNNVLEQSWTNDSSKKFSKYIYGGQLDLGALNLGGESDSATVTDQSAEVTDSDVRQGRQKVVIEAQSYSTEQLKLRAKWGKQIAKARANRYTCVVKGHQKPAGGDWKENELAQINSTAADITRMMLINTISFTEGEKQPTVTTLEFVEKNVYTVDEKLLSQKPTGKQNDAFTIS